MKYCTDPTVFVLFVPGMVIPMVRSCLLAEVLPEEVVAESNEDVPSPTCVSCYHADRRTSCAFLSQRRRFFLYFFSFFFFCLAEEDVAVTLQLEVKIIKKKKKHLWRYRDLTQEKEKKTITVTHELK